MSHLHHVSLAQMMTSVDVNAPSKEVLFMTVPTFDFRTSKLMSPEWCRANGFLSYEVRTQRMDDGQRAAFLMVRRAANGADFAVSKAKLAFFASKGTVPAFVVLSERDDSHVL